MYSVTRNDQQADILDVRCLVATLGRDLVWNKAPHAARHLVQNLFVDRLWNVLGIVGEFILLQQVFIDRLVEQTTLCVIHFDVSDVDGCLEQVVHVRPPLSYIWNIILYCNLLVYILCYR
ncbi:hypothetical protein D3C76_1172670 [compost metagenome]